MTDVVWEKLERELTEPSVGHPDVWATLSECLDVSRFSPRAAEYVEVARFDPARSDPYAIAANRRDLIYYRLSPAEADILETMDGSRPVAELVVDHLHDSGELDVAGVADLVRLLFQGNFLVNAYLDVPALVEKALHPRPVWRTKLSDFGKTLSIEWDGAERLVVWLYRNGLRHLCNRVGAVGHPGGVLGRCGRVLLGAGLGPVPLHHPVGGGGLRRPLRTGPGHHLHPRAGDATVLVRYGRRVKSAGFRIYFGSPAFFIESSDALMLDRRQRIIQAFAGPYFEFVASGSPPSCCGPSPGRAWPRSSTVCVLNYFVLILNLVPLLELDGYWILSDALRCPTCGPGHWPSPATTWCARSSVGSGSPGPRSVSVSTAPSGWSSPSSASPVPTSSGSGPLGERCPRCGTPGPSGWCCCSSWSYSWVAR